MMWMTYVFAMDSQSMKTRLGWPRTRRFSHNWRKLGWHFPCWVGHLMTFSCVIFMGSRWEYRWSNSHEDPTGTSAYIVFPLIHWVAKRYFWSGRDENKAGAETGPVGSQWDGKDEGGTQTDARSIWLKLFPNYTVSTGWQKPIIPIDVLISDDVFSQLPFQGSSVNHLQLHLQQCLGKNVCGAFVPGKGMRGPRWMISLRWHFFCETV